MKNNYCNPPIVHSLHIIRVLYRTNHRVDRKEFENQIQNYEKQITFAAETTITTDKIVEKNKYFQFPVSTKSILACFNIISTISNVRCETILNPTNFFQRLSEQPIRFEQV